MLCRLINFLFLFLFCCCSSNNEITDFHYGSDLNMEKGIISNSETIYTFSGYKKSGNIQALMDYIYFEGDTLCFSFDFKRDIPTSHINVSFITEKGVILQAERVEVKGDRVYGFSLVGSLLEKIYNNKLNDSLDSLKFPLKENLRVKINYSDNQVEIKKEYPLVFTLYLK